MFTFLILGIVGILAVFLQKNEIDITQNNRENDLLTGQLEQQSRALEKSLRYGVLTITVLRQFNLKKGLVLKFLYDTRIAKRAE